MSHLQHALLVFKALHGRLLPYLTDDCQLLADTAGAVNSSRLTLRLVLSCGLTRLSAIVVSLWLDREHGTVCLSNCDNQISALNNLGGYLRGICLAKDYGA